MRRSCYPLLLNSFILVFFFIPFRFSATRHSAIQYASQIALQAALTVLSPTERDQLRAWCLIAQTRSKASIEAHYDMLTYLRRTHDLMHVLTATRRNPSKLPISLDYTYLPGISLDDYVQASRVYDKALETIIQQAATQPRLQRALDITRMGARQALYQGFTVFCAQATTRAPTLIQQLCEAFDTVSSCMSATNNSHTRGWRDLVDAQVYQRMQQVQELCSKADIAFIHAHGLHKDAYLALQECITDLWISVEQERAHWYNQALELLA
jgi:hypothetical protein